MCGIVALISKQPNGLFAFDKDLFEEGLIADTVRGMDSTGVFGVTMKNELHVVKQGIDAITFMRSPGYKEWAAKISQYRAIVGHNRKATSGSIKSENAHPFKEGNIVLVHNGMLWNAKELNQEVEVDSHALCHEFATKGAKETLKNVSGAFALVWYDLEKKELYLWRNSERPLSLIEAHDKVIISSELQMMKWILSRDKRICDTKREGLLKENTLYTIQLNPYKISEESLSRVFVQAPVLNTTQHEWPHSRLNPNCMAGATDQMDEESLTHVEKLARELNEKYKVAIENKNHSATEIRKTYPFDSEVLFEVGDISIHTDVPKRYQIAGNIFLPGHPVVNGFIYTKNTDLKTIKLWQDAKKVVGTIGTVLGLANGSVCMHLEPSSIRMPACVKTRFRTNLPLIEWSILSHTEKCNKCHKEIDVQHPEQMSVNELSLGKYRVICGECLDVEFNKKKQKRLPAVLQPIEQNPEPKIHSVPLSADMAAVVEAVQRPYRKDTGGS